MVNTINSSGRPTPRTIAGPTIQLVGIVKAGLTALLVWLWIPAPTVAFTPERHGEMTRQVLESKEG